MADIRVTPETLEAQGKDLINYGKDLADILKLIDGKISEITDGWDGLAQDGYLQMYDSMKESLSKFPELVDALGQATTSAADAFSKVDEELKGAFSQSV